jgi:hypothetical protein
MTPKLLTNWSTTLWFGPHPKAQAFPIWRMGELGY